MSQSPKQPTVATPNNAAPANAPSHGFKALALPAVAAAARRKPPGRTERRTGLVLDPARYAD
jgi:hypothetical protein